MFAETNIRIDLLRCGHGGVEAARDGWIHVKTVPFCIFAQATLGRYALAVEGERFELAEGEAFLVPANLKLEIAHHVNPGQGRMDFRWMHFRFSLFSTLDLGEILDMPRRLDAATSAKVGDLAAAIAGLQDERSLTASLKRSELAYAAFGIVAALSPPKENFLARRKHLDAMLNVLKHIKSHLGRKMSVRELAAAARMSRAGFHAHFTGLTGCPPQQYILRERLALAAERLVATELSLEEIADSLGFKSPFHFSRRFRTQFGVPPGQYRERYRPDAYGI